MDFETYQVESQATDRNPGTKGDALIIPLLGLVGEAGTLLSEYKKLLRDGEAHARFHECVAEELGDLIWYVANVATKCDLQLNEIVAANLSKIRNRWLPEYGTTELFDDGFPPAQQLPRTFRRSFVHRTIDGMEKMVVLDHEGEPVGDSLTDNAYRDDGYRFHDVLHYAHAAVLGWSPVARKLLKRKRKADPKIDEVEDGGRAQVIEEAIAAVVYEYAERHDYLQGVESVDWELLRMIRRLTLNLEVSARTEAQWEQAILIGFGVWRQVRDANGGTIAGDLNQRTLEFVGDDA